MKLMKFPYLKKPFEKNFVSFELPEHWQELLQKLKSKNEDAIHNNAVH